MGLLAAGIAGATVPHGTEGDGSSRRIHTAHILDLAPDVPVVVIAIDREEKIDAGLPKIEAMVHGGPVTLERVCVAVSRPAPL